MRGGKGGALGTADIYFKLIPVDVPFAEDENHEWYEYDLNSDAAGMLLGVDRSTLWRYATSGRRGVFLPCIYPYGRGSRRYFRLSDLEDFARTAYPTPHRIRYSQIPQWYVEKHHRLDLVKLAKQRVTHDVAAVQAMPADERMAVELGWPRGTWAETYSDGVHVFGPSATRLNGTHKTEAEWMRARDEVTALGGDADTLLGKEFDKSG